MSSRIYGFITGSSEAASPFCGGLRHGIDRGDAFLSSTINEGAFTSSAEADTQIVGPVSIDVIKLAIRKARADQPVDRRPQINRAV